MNNRNLFLIVLEAKITRSACQHGQVRALFKAAEFLPYPHMTGGGGGGGISWLRILTPFMRNLHE